MNNAQEYHEFINYMKALKAFFNKQYDGRFTLGNVYMGNPDFSYFSLTTDDLKALKLKFVIVLHHHTPSFSICLSGQNKSIRKQYWEIIKEKGWHNGQLAQSIDDSLSIIEQTIVKNPDFTNKTGLTALIEREVTSYIDEVKRLLFDRQVSCY